MRYLSDCPAAPDPLSKLRIAHNVTGGIATRKEALLQLGLGSIAGVTGRREIGPLIVAPER